MNVLETMRQALEALYMSRPAYIKNALDKHEAAIAALRAAIEQMEKQEPVAWMTTNGALYTTEEVDGVFHPDDTPLYTLEGLK